MLPAAGVETPGVHEHDGFYLRVALGFAAMSDGLSARMGDYEAVGRSTGIATASELAIGGTPARGLVVGFGIYGSNVVASDFIPDADTKYDLSAGLPAGVSLSGANFVLLGPFFDYYLFPTRGYHIQAALGFAALSGTRVGFDQLKVSDNDPALGGGLMFGIGYEWWIGNQWSLGVLGRFSGAILGHEINNVRWLHVVGVAPGLLFGITYH
jgi:hypothetical protein